LIGKQDYIMISFMFLLIFSVHIVNNIENYL